MGIGIDSEEFTALDRMASAALHRFTERWFTPGERSWCVAQPGLARAVVVGICCKEAVFKAAGGTHFSPERIEIGLAQEGVLTAGRIYGAPEDVKVVWTTAGSSIFALAITSDAYPGLLPRLVQLVPGGSCNRLLDSAGMTSIRP